MNPAPPLFLLTITIHDFFKYASKGLGRVSTTSPYIHNTALNYAVNRFSSIHRIASGLKPHYERDFKKIPIYVTPAVMNITDEVVVSGEKLKFQVSREPVKITHNAVNTILQMTETKRLVFPALISYMSYLPMITFQAYALGGKPPSLIRLGKKEPPARVFSEKLDVIKRGRGLFEPNHPVNPFDLPKNSKIVDSELYPMLPSPLLLKAKIEGEFIEARDGRGKKHFVAIPDLQKYEKLMGLL